MSVSGSMPLTVADALWPAADNRMVRNAVLVVLASLFVAACAQVAVPMVPVPITGQTFGALTVGLLLGWRLGAASLALYLFEGAVGLPVFANFTGGWPIIAGPTGGYIVGFILAAGIVGWLAERGWSRGFVRTAAAMLVGNIALYIPGLAWLALFYAGPGAEYIVAAGATTALGAAIAAGLVPFIVGDLLKLALAAIGVPALWRLVRGER